MSSPSGSEGQPSLSPAKIVDPVHERITSDPRRADPSKFSVGHEISGRVVGQPDGDGANIQLSDGKRVATRLAYIDTPETNKPDQNKPGQPYGKEAMQYLHGLMQGKQITAKVVEAASAKNYWRPVVELYADGKNLNAAMLESGHAWPQKKYLPKEYSQAAAKGYTSGNIFSEYDPESPGAFRARLFSGLGSE